MTHFTPRQQQIMDGIRRELSYKEIGDELHMSHHTVRATVIQIANKLEATLSPDLPPRWRIYTFTKTREWESSHANDMPKAS